MCGMLGPSCSPIAGRAGIWIVLKPLLPPLNFTCRSWLQDRLDGGWRLDILMTFLFNKSWNQITGKYLLFWPVQSTDCFLAGKRTKMQFLGSAVEVHVISYWIEKWMLVSNVSCRACDSVKWQMILCPRMLSFLFSIRDSKNSNNIVFYLVSV